MCINFFTLAWIFVCSTKAPWCDLFQIEMRINFIFISSYFNLPPSLTKSENSFDKVSAVKLGQATMQNIFLLLHNSKLESFQTLLTALPLLLVFMSHILCLMVGCIITMSSTFSTNSWINLVGAYSIHYTNRWLFMSQNNK